MTGNVGSFSLLGREAVERMTGAWAGKRIQSGLKEMQLRGVQLQAQEHKHEQNRCGCGTENHEQKHEQQDLSEIQNILTECRKLVSDTIALTDKRLDELLVQQKAVFDAVNMLRNTVQTGRERDKEKRLLRRQQVRELEEERKSYSVLNFIFLPWQSLLVKIEVSMLRKMDLRISADLYGCCSDGFDV
jgi:hypothetical protein